MVSNDIGVNELSYAPVPGPDGAMEMYKGFDKNLQCRGFQYEVGKTYETDKAELRESGFHACEAPLDILRYYYPATSRYCEVTLDDVSPETEDDTKRVGKKITINKEIGLAWLIAAQADYVKKLDGDLVSTNTGNGSLATNTGNGSLATNTGNYSAATNTGERSAATVDGKASVALTCGHGSKVKGALGCAIVCIERGDWDGSVSPILAIKAAIVDGETIKADTWYTVQNGEWVEVEQ